MKLGTADVHRFVTNTKGSFFAVDVIPAISCQPINDLVSVGYIFNKQAEWHLLATDPCSVNHCQHHCRDHNGRAICECQPGFELAYDQKSCVSSFRHSGCTVNNGGCEMECIQSGNNFRCGCRAGFELNEDKRTCRGWFSKPL